MNIWKHVTPDSAVNRFACVVSESNVSVQINRFISTFAFENFLSKGQLAIEWVETV